MGGLGSGRTPDAKRRRRQAAVARAETNWKALEQAGLTLPVKKRGRKKGSSVETGEGRKGQGKRACRTSRRRACHAANGPPSAAGCAQLALHAAVGLDVQHKQLQFGHGFQVVLGDEHAQAAQMTLAPGEAEGEPDNRHREADQWLFVVAGTGEAILNGEAVPLKSGTLVLIQRGDTHEIRNTGDVALRTLNVYVPPAYTGDGEELPRGRK
jgi:mannose-6-phosphate isomerase-like protein (cupin superfamily)